MPVLSALQVSSRLALGLEFRDWVRDRDLIYPVRVERESGIPHVSALSDRSKFSYLQNTGRPPAGFHRHTSGRYSLNYHPDIRGHIDVRAFDFNRTYIPRRLRLPIENIDDVIARENQDNFSYMQGRAYQVVLFPGASYSLSTRATGLRGRVLRSNLEPLRWGVIEARALNNGDHVLAHTRSDDRGEFILLLPSHAVPDSDLPASIEFNLVVWGFPAQPALPRSDAAQLDAFWDVPLEIIPADDAAADDILAGRTVPSGFQRSISDVNVEFRFGRLQTSRDVGDLIFTTS